MRWTRSATDSHREWPFSAAYQMSLGSSVVVTAIQRGWITLMKTTFAEVGWWHLSVQNPLTREASNKVADIDVICCRDTFRDASFCERSAGLSVFFFPSFQPSSTTTHLISCPSNWSFPSLMSLEYKKTHTQRIFSSPHVIEQYSNRSCTNACSGSVAPRLAFWAW